MSAFYKGIIMLKIEEIIRKRYSVRTFNRRPVDAEIKNKIMEFADNISNPFGPKVRFKWLESGAPENGKLGTYGIIRGTDLYIGTAVPEDEHAMEALGYEMEELVLYMTGLGLGTCWLGGTFNRSAFEKAMQLKENELFTIVSPVGYAAEKKSLIEKIMRFGSKGDNRACWEELFFSGDFSTPLTEEEAGEYGLPLEMVRLAPSAVNRQPWRVLYKDGSFHFYEKHTKETEAVSEADMHRIDLGIGMCHFHKTADELGLKGCFGDCEPEGVEVPSKYEYIASWIIERK